MKSIILLCCVFCLSFSPSIFSETINYEVLRGQEIESRMPEIIELCDTIYRQYPYLYNGDNEGYADYIKSYSNCPNSVVVLTFSNNQAIGIATGMPMEDTREYYLLPFRNHQIDISSFFYLGEFGFKPESHHSGIAFEMYQLFEETVKEQQKYSTIAFWEILNPMKCEELHEAYRTAGFLYHPELNFELWWQNIGDSIESPHQCQYWLKSL